jgi:hypothetical protein
MAYMVREGKSPFVIKWEFVMKLGRLQFRSEHSDKQEKSCLFLAPTHGLPFVAS